MVRRSLIIYSALLFYIWNLSASQGGNDTFGHRWTDSKTPLPRIEYNWIDARDGTALFTTNKDDSITGPINLPFSFSFFGSNFTQIYVSTNGFISFRNTGSSPVNQSIPFTTGPDSMIAPYWDDLRAAPGGNVYYKETGTQPNKKTIIQWDNFYTSTPDSQITFQAILFEHSSLIKFQYLKTAGEVEGDSATVGINFENDGVQYAFNQPGMIAARLAILFHPGSLGNTEASITPNTVAAGTHFQEFTYRVKNFTAGVPGMGQMDKLEITNPFSASTPVVTEVLINSANVPIQQNANQPAQPGFANWSYAGNTLTVRTFHFDVIDSLVVKFVQTMPGSITSGNYSSVFDARFVMNPRAAIDAGWAVNVVGGRRGVL